VSPFFIPRILPNMAAGAVSIHYGLLGPNHAASTACASAAHSLGDAFTLIARGAADVMLAGGTEAAVDAVAIGGFSRLKALSTG
jgi:3-oxoacyl-[acyl-carrier-protein] synthase II